MLISEQIEQYVIDRLDNTLEILAVSAVVAGQQTVTFRCLKWMKLYDTLNGRTIVSYNGNLVTFTIGAGQDFTMATEATLQNPLFLNGTLSNTKYEWDKFELNERAKLPFVWLVSPTRENFEEETPTKNSECQLWFVHWSDWNLLNVDRQDEAIKPLAALVREFIKTIERQPAIFESYDNYSTKDFPKFGTETATGVGKMLFNSTLSAIEMNINVNIFRNCCENC